MIYITIRILVVEIGKRIWMGFICSAEIITLSYCSAEIITLVACFLMNCDKFYEYSFWIHLTNESASAQLIKYLKMGD